MGKMKRRMVRRKKREKRLFEADCPFEFKSKFTSKLNRIITFLTYSEQCGALRMICSDPLHYYQQLGWDALLSLSPTHFPYIPWLVIHRVGLALWNPENWPVLSKAVDVYKNRWEGRPHKVTFYLDDLVLKSREEHPAGWGLLDASDQLVTANEPLREQFIDMGIQIPIHIARTHIDCEGVNEVIKPTGIPEDLQKKFRVMWSSSGRVGITIMKKVFQKAQKLNDFKDVVFYVVANQCGLVRRELYPYNVDARYFEIMNLRQFMCLEKSCDLIINPMHSDDVIYVSGPEKAQIFVDCKSEVKFAHSGALEIPLITSPQRNYLYACRSGENSVVASKIDDWLDSIIQLKNDRDLGKKIASEARKKVLAEYDTKIRAKQYLSLFGDYKEDDE